MPIRFNSRLTATSMLSRKLKERNISPNAPRPIWFRRTKLFTIRSVDGTPGVSFEVSSGFDVLFGVGSAWGSSCFFFGFVILGIWS